MTRIKISGLVTPRDAEVVAGLGVDYAACIFYAPSPRYVTIETAVDIRRTLPSHVRLVGVFVDTPTPIVQRIVHHCRLDYAQLFGAETRASVEMLRPHAFKAVTVSAASDVEGVLRTFVGRFGPNEEHPALVLHYADTVATPWAETPADIERMPLFLASRHIDAASVGSTVAASKPWGIDVWNSVESEPGKLDYTRLEDFVGAVREADAAALDSRTDEL